MSQSVMTSKMPAQRRITVNTRINHEDVTKSEAEAIIKNKLAEPIANELETLHQAFQASGQKMEIKPSPITKKQPEPIDFTEPNLEDLPVQQFRQSVGSDVKKPASELKPSKSSVDLGPHAIRTGLPSGCIFYDFDYLFIKNFGVPQITKIFSGNKQKREDLIIDVIDECIFEDAWNLTEKDFRSLMYWERINSMPRNPYNLTWTSFYGNQNQITINNTTLKTKYLENTSREEYQEWLERGFKMPTMRDLFNYANLEKELSDEDKFLWIRAKYINADSVAEKLAAARRLSLDEFFTDIGEFVAKFEAYGVTESAEVKDAHFNADAAIVKLNTALANSKAILEANNGLTEMVTYDLLNRIARIEEEIGRINSELANRGEAAPMSETVTFKIDVTDFFPLLQY